MTIPSNASIETRCIHAGQEPDPASGAVMTPIVLATTFAQDGPGAHKGYDYSRAGNPTRTALEHCLASLESASHGVAFGSGCAATTAVLLTLRSGDHVLVGDDVYGGTFRIFDGVLAQFGLEATFIDMSDPARVAEAIQPNTRLVWAETPSNPMLKILDVAAIAEIARARRVPLAIDNTFATPMLQQPLQPRRDPRRAFDDEVPERALRRRRRRRDDKRRRHGRAPALPSKIHWGRPEPL